MSNVEQEVVTTAESWWSKFMGYTAKNPGFWTGGIIGAVLGWFAHGL